MATRRRTNAKGTAGSLAAIAVTLGPLVVPALTNLVKDPEALNKVTATVRGILARDTKTPEDLDATIVSLREQVAYLAESADDDAETKRAKDWARSLDQAGRAAKLVAGPGASAKEKKIVKKKVATLRTEILQALIIEKSEDLEVKPPSGA